MTNVNESNGTVAPQKQPAHLAVLGAVPMSTGLVLRTMDEAMSLAKVLAASNLLPDTLAKSPENVLVVMLKGLELGLKPMQALNEIHVVKGKPGCSAALKRALVLQSGLCEYFRCVETSDKRAVFVTKRRSDDEPVRLSWTIEQAQAAGLTGKDVWKSHPAAMLRARASSALADLVYPDVVQGLASTDELEEIRGQVVSVRVNHAPVSAGAPTVDSVVETSGGQRWAEVVSDEPLVEPVADEAPSPTPPKATQSQAVKAAGGITHSDMDRAGAPPVGDAMSDEDKLHAVIDECVKAKDAKALNALTKDVNKFTGEAHVRLKQHWIRGGKELSK